MPAATPSDIGARAVDRHLALRQELDRLPGPARLAGEEISFELTDPATQTRYVCNGRILGHNISGSIQVASANAQRQLGWDAARTELGTPAHTLLKQPTMQELQEKMQP